MIQFFDDQADLDRCLALAETRIMPILELIDEQEDPANQIKIQTALFILLTKKAVLEHGLDVPTATHIIERLIQAILEDRREGREPGSPSRE